MRNLVCLFASIYSSLVCAGPHTIQKGETFADVTELYGIPLDSIISANIDTNGNWISHEMVAADNDNHDKINTAKSKDRYDGFDEIRSNNEAYYAERYGDKECDFCHGTGNCPTCGGNGYNYNSFRVKRHS